jgi:hypothetical protein
MVAATRDDDDEEATLRAQARLSAEEELAEHDLGLFIERTTPGYSCPEHARPLLDALDRSMREPVYALVEMAPRHTKTDDFLHAMVRRLRYRSTDHVQYCSYAAPIALRKSRKAREIASRAGVWTTDEQRRGNKFDPSTSVSYWQTIDGGSFTAGGRGGAFVGDGSNMTVYDDPFKNRDEAESPVIQEKVIETWRGTLANRIEPGGSGFITHQPWNDFDPIALLKAETRGLDGQQWEVISLPAVIDAVYDDDGNLIGGTPLWPARWSLKALSRIKYLVKDYNWYSQYQLDRRPKGDRLFNDCARYAQPRADGAVILISCDPGIEDNEMKDSSGIVVGCCYRLPTPFYTPGTPDFEVWIDVLLAEDQWRTIPDLLDYLEALQSTMFPGAPVVLEEVSAFKALSQVAARLNKQLTLYSVTPKGNKYLRAQPTAAAWNAGHIRTPLEGAWVADFHHEMRRFTGKAGGKDNRVDALTQMFDAAERVLASLAAAQSGGDTVMASSPF